MFRSLLALITLSILGGEAMAQPSDVGLPIRVLEMPELPQPRVDEQAAQREEENLRTQHSVAESNRALVELNRTMVGLTQVQVVLGALGTLALIITLWLTRRSTNAAVSTAQSNRAWLVFDYWRVHGLGNAENLDVRTAIGFQPHFMNGGSSPALGAVIWNEAKVISDGEPIPTFSVEKSDEVSRAPIGVNKHAIGPGTSVDLPDLRRVYEGSHRAILYARADFTDIYGIPRYSEVCVEISFQRLYEEIEQSNFRSDVFAFRAVGEQNTAS